MTTTTDRPEPGIPPAPSHSPRSAHPPAGRRALLVTTVAFGGGLVGYGLSLLVSGCTTCATGASPISFGALLGLVAGWSAYNATASR